MVLKLEDLPHSLSLMSVTWSAYGNTGDQKLIKLFDANAPQALDIKQVCLVWYCMFYIALLALQDMCEVPLLGILEQAAFLRPTGASGEFGRRLCDRISVKEWLSPQAGYTIFQVSKRFIGCGIAPTWLDFSAFRCLYPLVFLSGYGTGSKHAKAGELNDFKHAATHLWSQTVSWTSWRGVTSQEHVFCIAFSTWSARCCSTPSKTMQRIFCANHRNWLFLIDGSCHFWTQWLPIKLLIVIM